ncbi:MAG: LCP family protein [Lachnospiraceae bacterium]|nr:LCP family protein [Lachnospiraceae bacterium]
MNKTDKPKKEQPVKRSTGENDLELAEEQKVHQEHLRRLRKYKKKHKQQVVGLILELVLLVVVIGGFVAVSWTERILNNMQIKNTTTASAEPTLPVNTTPGADVPGVTTAAVPQTTTTEVISWVNPSGTVETGTMPPQEPYTNPLPRRAVEAQEGYDTIVCFGVDARNTTDLLRNTQGDVIIVMTINKETGEIRMSSVYRDFFFEFAAGQYCKLTDAYNRYGAEQVVAGLNRNLDLNITHFVVVNWAAVVDLVDMVGGIDLEVTAAEAEELDGLIYEIEEAVKKQTTTKNWDYEPGIKHMDGVYAVAYSRIRKNTGSDYARTERQRKVINVVLDKIKEMVRRGEIFKVMQIVETLSTHIKTNMETSEIVSYATGASRYSISETVGFPMSPKEDPAGSWALLSLDYIGDVQYLHKLLYDLDDYEPSDNIIQLAETHRYQLETGAIRID